VNAGLTSTVNFSVTCTALVGTVQGTISSSLGGGIAGVSVVVDPANSAAEAAVLTGALGGYSVPNVDIGFGAGAGTGTIGLSALPAGCSNPGLQPYSGLTSGSSVTVDITVVCVPPPAGYNFSSTWSAPGATITVTIQIDMGSFDDPAISGADDVFAIQGSTSYSPTRLAITGCSNVAGSGLSNGTFNTATAGVISWINLSTSPPETGLQGIAVCTFTVLAGAPQAVTTTTSISGAGSQNGTDLIPRILITEGTTNLP
jgi:hypothetical protein